MRTGRRRPIPYDTLSSLDDLSPDWLSAALARRYPGVRVEDARQDGVIHGTATKAKLQLAYNAAGREAGLPQTMWLKAALEAHTEAVAKLGIYAAEARFYRDLQAEVPINTPRCFHAAVDAERATGVMLLEDLGNRGARLAYAPKPASVDEAASTLESLARMHARFWRSSRLDEIFPPVLASSGPSPFGRAHEPNAIAATLEDPRADGVPRALRDPERMSRAVLTWRAQSNDRVTFIHGDSHYGNVFYDADGRSGHYDWQNYRCGHWCHDVSYFLVSALSVRDRERDERRLIDLYARTLRAGGVDEVSADEAWLRYRQHIIYGLWIFLANWEEMQPFEVNATYVTRFAAAASDHDTYRLLEDADGR